METSLRSTRHEIVVRPRRRRRPIFAAGVFIIGLGIVGFVVGWITIQSLTSDLRASLAVSRSAVVTIGETVELAAELAEGTTDAMDSATLAASSAADATRTAATGVSEVVVFLEADLPQNIEAIRRSLPGAIGAADAIDTTLGAISLIGLDYSPDEPFGDSLRRIQAALEELPDVVREQSDALSLLVPAAERVADDVDGLAGDLGELSSSLVEVDALAEMYSDTVTQAEAAVVDTTASVDRTVLVLRILLTVAALGAVVLGYALLVIDRELTLPRVFVEPRPPNGDS